MQKIFSKENFFRKSVVVPVSILAINALHIFKFIFLCRLIDFHSPFPIVDIDYIQYFARTLRAHDYLGTFGRMWGYNPYQMAGFPCGIYDEAGNYLINFLCHWLAPFISIDRSLLIIEILSLFLLPYLIIYCIRLIGGTKIEGWIGFAIFVASCGSYEPDHLNIGLFGFICGSSVALVQITSLYKWINQFSYKNYCVFLFATIIAILLHPATVLIMLVPDAVLFFLYIRKFKLKFGFLLLLAVGITISCNLFWLRPYFNFQEWSSVAPYLTSRGLIRTIDFYFNPFKLGVPQVMQSFFHLLVVIGSSYAFFKIKEKPLRILFCITSIWLFFIASKGSSFPFLEKVQPARFIIIFFFWQFIFIPLAISKLSSQIINYKAENPNIPALLLAFTFLCFYGYFGTLTFDKNLNNLLPRDQQSLYFYLVKNKPHDGRILFEVRDDADPRLCYWLSTVLKVPMIGGPDAGNHMIGRFSRFSGLHMIWPDFVGTPVAFDQYVDRISIDDFKGYLDLYNVSQVISMSKSMKDALSRFKEFVIPIRTVAGYQIYDVKINKSWLWEGVASVQADYDVIQLENVKSKNLVLKYHWIKTLKATPPVEIKPIYLKNDPAPFIQINNPTNLGSITIINSSL